MSHSLAQSLKGSLRLLIGLLVVVGMVAVPIGKSEAFETPVEQIWADLSFGGMNLRGFEGDFVVEVTDPTGQYGFSQQFFIEATASKSTLRNWDSRCCPAW